LAPAFLKDPHSLGVSNSFISFKHFTAGSPNLLRKFVRASLLFASEILRINSNLVINFKLNNLCMSVKFNLQTFSLNILRCGRFFYVRIFSTLILCPLLLWWISVSERLSNSWVLLSGFIYYFSGQLCLYFNCGRCATSIEMGTQSWTVVIVIGKHFRLATIRPRIKLVISRIQI